MLSEIGSNFWLPQGEKVQSQIDTRLFCTTIDDSAFTSSGRCAISLVLTDITVSFKRALLPSFTCESVIDPFVQQGYKVAFYSLGDELNITRERFLDEVRKANPEVILIHNYFGFNTTSEIRGLIQNLKEEGVVVIEDLTQSLYSSFGRLPADYYIGSFRKWDGIPDGGFALKTSGYFKSKPSKEDSSLVAAKISAMLAKYEFLFNNQGEKAMFLEKFSEAERLLEDEKEIFRMSDFSQKEQANLNVEKLKKSRRRNYSHLLQSVSESVKPLFGILPDEVVPLYFPIICKNRRTEIQIWLRSNSIFAPVVWPKPRFINFKTPGADYFYEKLLCIPCDQRYGDEEMNKIASILNLWNGAAL